MKRISLEQLLGGVLTAVGVLALLLNLGLFGAAASLIWALLFGAGGVALLGVVAQNRERWWALIPGATLLSLGLLIALTTFAPVFGAAVGGSIFLGGIGAGFLAVYLLRPQFWWALIPAGTLLTLAVVAGMGGAIASQLTGAVFFGGLALTFALVAVAPPDAPRRWALIPGAVLLTMAALSLIGSPTAFNILGPSLLILGGLALLYRALRHKTASDEQVAQPGEQPVHHAPR